MDNSKVTSQVSNQTLKRQMGLLGVIALGVGIPSVRDFSSFLRT